MSKNGDNRNIRVLQFLDAYEKQESLWNPSLESYKNKAARDAAYMHIIRELNLPTLTIHDVKLKVKSIRTTYTKELRLVIKHKEQGKPYNPKLFWFNRANAFLKDVSLSRDKRSSFSGKATTTACKGYKRCDIEYNAKSDEHLDIIPSVETDSCDASLNSYDYKGVRNSEFQTQTINVTSNVDLAAGEQPEEIVSSLKNNITVQEPSLPGAISNISKYCDAAVTEVSETTTSNVLSATPCMTVTARHHGSTEDDEYDIFCRSVAAQLRGISDVYSRSVAKLKIQQILFEAEIGHYRNNPCITIPVNQNLSSI